MKTSTLVLVGAGAVGLYMLMQGGMTANAVHDLQVQVTMPGMPNVSNGVLQVPVKVNIYNYHPVALPVQSLIVTAERETSPNVWSQFAFSKPESNGLIIRPRDTTSFEVVMQATIGSMLMDLFQVATGGIPKRIRINVVPVVMGTRLTPISQVFDFN